MISERTGARGRSALALHLQKEFSMVNVLFVSVNQSFNSDYTLAELEPYAARAWATTVAKAMDCDRLIAVYQGFPVAAWRLRGAYPDPYGAVYKVSNGDERIRTALSLGDPLPILPAYHPTPSMRQGAAIVDLDVEPLEDDPGLDD